MAGNAYWKNRQARLMYGRMDDAEVAAGSVSRIYAKASAEITRQTRDIFQVYQDKWNLTEKEARRLLSVMDGGFFNSESLRRGINTIADEELRNQMLRDLETPAYQARLRRLQELQEQLDQMMVDVYQKDRQMQTEHYIRTGTDTYYRGIYDVQRQVGFQFSFAHIDQKTFDRLLKSKWSGKNFSSRIWDNTQQVADTVKEELLLEMLTGKTLDDCAEAIQYRFQVGAHQSRRLIRTESNFVSGQMQLKAYEECDAEYYEYVATLDSRTDEECGRLDGKRFKVSDARPGVNFHPMHPFCRCSDIIALDDDMKAGLERRARDPKTGKLVKVPASTNYMQWAKDNGLKAKQKKVVQLPPKAKSEEFTELRKNPEEESWTKRTKESDNTKNVIDINEIKQDVHTVGFIDRKIYQCITDDIVTDEVIITDSQIQHIRDSHPESAEKVLSNIEHALRNPDYIFDDEKHKNTGLVIKKIDFDENLQIVLKVATSKDKEGMKNSIISGWMIGDKRLERYFRKKKLIYKKNK